MDEEESESIETGFAAWPGAAGGFRTYFVFLDLPTHVEIRAPDMPLLDPGTAVEFDIRVRHSKNPSATKHVSGPYVVERRVLRFGGARQGLVQYLEWRCTEQASR